MKAILLVVVTALGIAVVASCSDDPTPQPCTGIPAGGCPLSHGVACDDPSCAAVYKCLAGNHWELDHVCPANEGGARDASVDDASDAAPVQDASIDAPPGAFGGPGCNPLETPDCALGTALLCSAACCGCEDLYVCDNGGWTFWGTCGDAGPVPSR